MFKDIFEYENNLTVSGLNSSLINEYILNFSGDRNVLVVTDTLFNANNIYKYLHRQKDSVYFFPMDEFVTSLAVSVSPDLKVIRIDTLNNIDDKKNIIVTNLSGYLKYLDRKTEKLKVDKTTKRSVLLNFLENNSYIKTNLVTSTGEYAVRSFIIDVFPINSQLPVRFEFFGNDLESIRYFDFETQISTDNINEITLYSFSEDTNNEKEVIYDKLSNPFVFFVDYKNIVKHHDDYKLYLKEFNIDKNMFKDFECINVENKIFINTIDDEPICSKIKKYKSNDIINFNNNYDNLYKFVNENKDKYTIIFMITNKVLENKIINMFANDISLNHIVEKRINIINKYIEKGYQIDKYIVISEYDIESIKKSSHFLNKFNIGRKIKGYEDLKKGDYVVHVSHGIGQYQGLVTIDYNNIKKDYLLICYSGNDKVYVPAHKIETIYKYADADISEPKLNSLNSNNWLKTKERVRNSIKDISTDLIKLYAEREILEGESYLDFPEEEIFANDFEYEETKDQIKSIKDILKDLNKKRPMDRLLCGDVGFGKTEVAMRAMFKTIINNRQVVYLCPTTILSKQQYENCLKRFRHFPINIEILNRFTSLKEFNRIKEGLEKGTIDLVVGTHKLLNSDIKYKQLGLLVIDEEQRFGVSQKEKIKQLKANVNVLTLSATPIPRTLKMAMSGVKDMSIIDTAPINRYPVQTYVVEDNDYLLKEAIYKEMSRDGQVYILINNIETLNIEYDKLCKLVPDAKIGIAHGKMDKDSLNDIISDFIDRKYDILLCTTIIETGIDIPNVNTLIVKNADRFGLSQLYQIRGRVGRSDRIAYAYMMYEKNKMLNDIAIKRLQTIKDFTELGSGYKIAMRDLSIRGAGELLGSSQSGFVSSIGIDLYMDIVNEEINKLKGIEEKEISDNKKNFLDVSTSISENYVDDESLRIEIHKLINKINSKESFDEVKYEIEDRFGKINNDIINYMYEEWFQKEAEKLEINNIKYLNNVVEIEIPENISSYIDGEKLFLQIYSINHKFKIRYSNKKLYISLNIVNRNGEYVKDLLDVILLLNSCIKKD